MLYVCVGEQFFFYVTQDTKNKYINNAEVPLPPVYFVTASVSPTEFPQKKKNSGEEYSPNLVLRRGRTQLFTNKNRSPM